jgi:hypothetical protein
VVGDEAALSLLISASGNCTMSATLPTLSSPPPPLSHSIVHLNKLSLTSVVKYGSEGMAGEIMEQRNRDYVK